MKPKVAIVSGGYTDEDVISFQSGDVVANNLPTEEYDVYRVTITRTEWFVENSGNKTAIDKNDFSFSLNDKKVNFDVVFIAVHGPPGEDGKLQGYFDMIGLPYTTCTAAIASLTFNKSFTNRVLGSMGIKTAPAVLLNKNDLLDVDHIIAVTGLPCFVKPNASGSSLGISKVNSKEEMQPAIDKAFTEDNAVIIEKFMEGTEITCGVVNWKGKIKALGITEIVSTNEFFDYDAKYHNKGTQEITPARIDKNAEEKCLEISKKIYRLLSCRGIVRADYILSKEGLSLIEINTVPGLSERSLVPQQAEFAGISLAELFSNCIEEALGKFASSSTR